MVDIPKYPRTPYWPSSPSIDVDDRIVNPLNFVNRHIVITEKLDGSCTLLHDGEVYSRSTSAPSNAKWHGMVRKHHAWKLNGMKDFYLYGEDIYGVHSIEYEPVDEDKTFYAFALRIGDAFVSFPEMKRFVSELEIPVDPTVLSYHKFGVIYGIDEYLRDTLPIPSHLGGEKEGMVIWSAEGFPADTFAENVCKYVRPNHVQIDAEHWTKYWKPAKLRRQYE